MKIDMLDLLNRLHLVDEIPLEQKIERLYADKTLCYLVGLAVNEKLKNVDGDKSADPLPFNLLVHIFGRDAVLTASVQI